MWLCASCGRKHFTRREPNNPLACQTLEMANAVIEKTGRDLAAAQSDNKTLRLDLTKWENDSACLPEDQSITETVGALRAEVEKWQIEAINAAGARNLAQAERDRLRAALVRIRDGEDAPDCDLGGERQIGVHCGVEDRGCSDRYEGADYGYAQGVERALEWASNEADAALTSEALAGAGSSWRPIEEAPVDQEIIVYREDAGVFPAIYREAAGDDAPEGLFWFACGGYEDITDDPPTLWRPLPAAPERRDG
jgi:hypothetical protein